MEPAAAAKKTPIYGAPDHTSENNKTQSRHLLFTVFIPYFMTYQLLLKPEIKMDVEDFRCQNISSQLGLAQPYIPAGFQDLKTVTAFICPLQEREGELSAVLAPAG